jgi:nitrogen regulatory protein PII
MFHPATKFSVITEHFLIEKVCHIIEECGGRGYTLVPVGGKGLHHLHHTLDQATAIEGFDNLKVEVVTSSREKAERIAQRVMLECLTENPGIMFLETIEVFRSERFE